MLLLVVMLIVVVVYIRGGRHPYEETPLSHTHIPTLFESRPPSGTHPHSPAPPTAAIVVDVVE